MNEINTFILNYLNTIDAACWYCIAMHWLLGEQFYCKVVVGIVELGSRFVTVAFWSFCKKGYIYVCFNQQRWSWSRTLWREEIVNGERWRVARLSRICGRSYLSWRRTIRVLAFGMVYQKSKWAKCQVIHSGFDWQGQQLYNSPTQNIGLTFIKQHNDNDNDHVPFVRLIIIGSIVLTTCVNDHFGTFELVQLTFNFYLNQKSDLSTALSCCDCAFIRAGRE